MEFNYKYVYEIDAKIFTELLTNIDHFTPTDIDYWNLENNKIMMNLDIDPDTFQYLEEKAIKEVNYLNRMKEKATIDLDALFEQSKKELRSIGIPIISDDKLRIELKRFNKTSLEALCYTIYKKDSHDIRECFIQIKPTFISGKHPDKDHLHNIILHELVHTCPECHDTHNGKFKEYAIQIYNELGYCINELERTASYKHADKPVQVKGECPVCHWKMIFRTDQDIEDYFLIRRFTIDEEDPNKAINGMCPYCGEMVKYVHVK